MSRTVMARLGRWSAVAVALVLTSASATLAAAVTVLPPDQAEVRLYANGAGPQMLLRVGRDEPGKRDLFAVVDPSLWRIQFFALEDWTIDDPRPLTARWSKRGDCDLPASFRPWRAHFFADRIVIQSQPIFNRAKLDSGRDFDTRKIELRPTPAFILAMLSASPTAADARPSGASCPAETEFVAARDVGQAVTGGEDTADFRVTRRGWPASTPAFLKATMRIDHTGRYLASVQELEDAVSVNSKERMRQFLVTTRTGANPGFSTSRVTVERFSERGTLDKVIRIDLGSIRIKQGQRPVAIASTGEVLVMGTGDHTAFYVRSCAFMDRRKIAQTCAVGPGPGGDTPAAREGDDGGGVQPPPPAPAKNAAAWTMAEWFVTQRYTIDASTIIDDCRNLKPCQVNEFPWAPPHFLRRETGVVTRIGTPYAQNQESDTPERGSATFTFPVSAVTPAYLVSDGQPAILVGDIENDGATAAGPTRILGIDCSRFVSRLWGRGSAGTKEYRKLVNEKGIRRVGGLGGKDRIEMGDAFLIRFSGQTAAGPALWINHVVVFRESRRASPFESWKGLLVAESSSGCGGACFSLYDESFFNGWALMRNSPAVDNRFELVPETQADWNRRFATP